MIVNSACAVARTETGNRDFFPLAETAQRYTLAAFEGMSRVSGLEIRTACRCGDCHYAAVGSQLFAVAAPPRLKFGRLRERLHRASAHGQNRNAHCMIRGFRAAVYCPNCALVGRLVAKILAAQSLPSFGVAFLHARKDAASSHDAGETTVWPGTRPCRSEPVSLSMSSQCGVMRSSLSRCWDGPPRRQSV
jgi:hypothetical protein